MRKAARMQIWAEWTDGETEKKTTKQTVELIKTGNSRIRRAEKIRWKAQKRPLRQTTVRAAAYGKQDNKPERRACDRSHQMFTDASTAPLRRLHINFALLLQMWLYRLQPWFTPRRRADRPRLPGPIQTKRHSGEEGAAAEAAGWA